MGIYDNNIGNLAILSNTSVSTINSNCGNITVGSNCDIVQISSNNGNLVIGSNVRIGSISNNNGSISIDCNGNVGSISNNNGSIHLKLNGFVETVRNDNGSITGESNTTIQGRNIMYSGNGSSYSISSSDGLGISYSNGTSAITVGRRPFIMPSGSGTTINVEPCQTVINYSPSAAPSVETDKDRNTCAICMENPKNVAFQCGHVCCTGCAEGLQSCHLCRQKISQRIKLFL